MYAMRSIKHQVINLNKWMNVCMPEDEIRNTGVIFSEESNYITPLTNMEV
jgi:hypothetical protein